jgi:hypothetical protein|tara:strand:- start:865 stop:1035 length:171 start_codon:yes stop_codon:yes gene_type:complete
MKNNYSVEEILHAIDELQNIKKEREKTTNKKSVKIDSSNIPKDTLKLIEEAEKYKS